MKTQNLEWHKFEDDLLVHPVWETEREESAGNMDQNRPKSLRHTSHRSRIYEVAVALILVYGVVEFLIWQQAERRIAYLEDELVQLQSQLSAFPRSSEPNIFLTGNILSPSTQFLETAYFRFLFDADHQNVVKAVAAMSDPKYIELRRKLGLALPDEGKILTIAVGRTEYEKPEEIDDDMPYDVTIHWSERLTEMTEGEQREWLENQLFGELSTLVYEEVIGSREIKPQWQALVESLKMYLWLEHGPLSDWRQHEPFIRRRRTAQHRSLDQALVSYDQYAQDVAFDGDLYSAPHQLSQYEVANPLIEFIVTEYGYERLPGLLDAFSHYENWEVLAPPIFQRSAKEFEAEWHVYLRERYP
ncbi:hypothetical protein KFU94_60290 [Chloroflexi bacterium TSY]|nr:hypothetical protein [Chloroflexi bacterium TSY]